MGVSTEVGDDAIRARTAVFRARPGSYGSALKLFNINDLRGLADQDSNLGIASP
jgi:hypothetical protein